MRVLESTLGRNGLNQIQCVAEDISTYDFYTEPGLPSPDTDQGNTIPETQAHLLDIHHFPMIRVAKGFCVWLWQV